MRVVVAFPWRATPERRQAFEFVVNRYRHQLPDAIIGTADGSPPDHGFNRAASRNACVRLAQNNDADVVVIPDADSHLEDRPLMDAVDAAVDGGLHLPYTRQMYLTAEETQALYDGLPVTEARSGGGEGVCYIIRPDQWWEIGGQDERFGEVWGGEDTQIAAAGEALIGLHRYEGLAMSLHHADEHRPVGADYWKPNSELSLRYAAARRSPVAMRALIAEHRSTP